MLVGRSSTVASAKWSRKPGPMKRAEGGLTELRDALDEVDRGDSLLAVGAHVVADDEGAVRPADEHRPVEAQLVDDRREVVGPERVVRVVLGLERRLGHAVAAQVVGDKPELVGQRALVLLGPAQMVLRPAVDEQDRRPVGLAPLTNVQPQAATAPDRVGLPRTRQPFRHALRHCRHRSPPRGRRLDRSSPARSGSTSGGGPYLCPGGRRIFRLRDARRALPDGGLGAILAEMEVRASDVFVGRVRELEALGRVLDAMQAGKRCDRPRRRRGRHRQDPPGVRARRTRPRRRLRDPPRALDRSRRHGAAVPAVRRGTAAARAALASRSVDARLAAAGVRGDARAAHRPGSHRAGAARARGSPLGRYVDRSISSSSSRTTSTTGRFCCSRPTARTSPRRRSACAGSRSGFVARARRFCSSSGRSSPRS